MENLWTQVQSSSWWVGVVVVGIVINLVSAYLKPRLDGTLSHLSNRWATRSELQRQKRTARIELLRGNEREQLFEAVQLQEPLLKSCILHLLVVIAFLFNIVLATDTSLFGSTSIEKFAILILSWILKVGGLVVLITGMRETDEYLRRSTELKEARQRTEP